MSEDSVAGSEISVTFSVTLRCGRPRGAEVSASGSDGVESLTSPVRKVAGRLPAFWSDAVTLLQGNALHLKIQLLTARLGTRA